MEIIVEAMFGKKFKIVVTQNGKKFGYLGIASANAKPNERPYRITWFSLGSYFIREIPENRHIDLTLEEMQEILKLGQFPPEIIKRVKEKYPPNDPMVGDEYVISS